jgi:hypothetical protein
MPKETPFDKIKQGDLLRGRYFVLTWKVVEILKNSVTVVLYEEYFNRNITPTKLTISKEAIDTGCYFRI